MMTGKGPGMSPSKMGVHLVTQGKLFPRSSQIILTSYTKYEITPR